MLQPPKINNATLISKVVPAYCCWLGWYAALGQLRLWWCVGLIPWAPRAKWPEWEFQRSSSQRYSTGAIIQSGPPWLVKCKTSTALEHAQQNTFVQKLTIIVRRSLPVSWRRRSASAVWGGRAAAITRRRRTAVTVASVVIVSVPAPHRKIKRFLPVRRRIQCLRDQCHKNHKHSSTRKRCRKIYTGSGYSVGPSIRFPILICSNRFAKSSKQKFIILRDGWWNAII